MVIVPETPAQKALRRTGPCIAVVCHERCETFFFELRQDGFNICVCGHTQHAHAFEEA